MNGLGGEGQVHHEEPKVVARASASMARGGHVHRIAKAKGDCAVEHGHGGVEVGGGRVGRVAAGIGWECVPEALQSSRGAGQHIESLQFGVPSSRSAGPARDGRAASRRPGRRRPPSASQGRWTLSRPGSGTLGNSGWRAASLAEIDSPFSFDSTPLMLSWLNARSDWNSVTAGLASASLFRIASASPSGFERLGFLVDSGEDGADVVVALGKIALELNDGRIGIDQRPKDRQRPAVRSSASDCLPMYAQHEASQVVAIRQVTLEPSDCGIGVGQTPAGSRAPGRAPSVPRDGLPVIDRSLAIW